MPISAVLRRERSCVGVGAAFVTTVLARDPISVRRVEHQYEPLGLRALRAFN
jgi:hypothetical protein